MLIAENELLGAAESIEKAAKKLASLKPRREVRGKVGTVVNPSPPPCVTPIQSWARYNTAATTWPCFQATQLLVLVMCLCLLWLLHLYTETLKNFEFFLVAEDLLRCTEAKNLSRAQLCPCLSRVNPNNEDVNRVALFITCNPYLYLKNTLCCFGWSCVNPM